MSALTILIQGTALMLALLALRPLLKRYLSPRLRCALWSIPALRLLFPFEMQSRLSVMTPVQPVAERVESAVSQPLPVDAPSWLGTGIGLQGGEAPAVNTVPSTVPSIAPTVPVQDAGAAPELSLGSILMILWLIGTVITGGIILYQNLRFYASARRLAQPYGCAGKLPVYLIKGLPTPCLAGVFRPRVYINEQALVSEDVLEMTLRHELTHYKRLDHIWSAARGLLLSLYWFHPLVWVSSELFRCDCETACDAAATRGMDDSQRESYGMALITLASRNGKRDAGRLVCLSTMGGSKKLLKERITQLAKGRSFRFAAMIALLLAAVLCFTMCTVPRNDGELSIPNDDLTEQDDASTPQWEPLVIDGYVLSDGAQIPVRLTLEITDVLKCDVLHAKDVYLSSADADHEYIVVTMNVRYDDGEADSISMSEDRTTLDDAKLYFSLANAANNAVDVTASLENSIYEITLSKGESATGAVAFLQEKGNTQPMYFTGFGQHVWFLINGAVQADAPDVTDVHETELDIVDMDFVISGPALGIPGVIEDLAWCLELTMPETEFKNMSEDEMSSIVSEYEYLLDDYRLMGRVSEDGTIRYIVGQYNGDFENSGFCGLYSIETNSGDQFLYRPEDVGNVEEDIAHGRTPDGGILLEHSTVTHFSNSSLILIQPNESTVPLDGVCYYYVERPNGRSYILDAVSRGISIGATQEPYLGVYRISEQYGEIMERIALTEEQAEQILSEPLVEITDGYGIVASLHYNGKSELFMQSEGIPQTVLDLARSRCEYTFASPADITAPIVKATLECSWLYEPLYADASELAGLSEILKGAKFGYVGACGYGAKLTIEMADGETLVLFKGTDGCDTIVFGSYGGYFLGNKQNAEFWQIFGLDPDTKELMDPEQTFLDAFPMDLLFASGAGAWGTTLTLNADGTFEGHYSDADMGDSSTNYPNGTVYFCDFTGRFSAMTKISEYAYSMRIEELTYDRDVGKEQRVDGLRYVTAEPYGMAGGEEFIIYVPGTPVEELSEDLLSWWPDAYKWRQGELDSLTGYGLYNVSTGQAFFSRWLA